MFHRDLKIKVKDIQHQYPLSKIRNQTLIVNCADMSLLACKEPSTTSFKSRPTARKSTNSKYKTRSDDFPSVEIDSNSDELSEDTTSTTCVQKENTEKGSLSSLNNTTFKSIICPDNKIKITKSVVPPENSHDSKLMTPNDVDHIDPVKCGNTGIVSTDEVKPVSNNYVSDDSGCATSSSSSECPVDCFKTKENFIMGSSSKEHVVKDNTSKKNDESSVQKVAAVDCVALSNCLKSDHETAEISASTNPSDIKRNNRSPPARDTKCSMASRKLKIENIVDHLNSKQTKADASSSSETATNKSFIAKRQLIQSWSTIVFSATKKRSCLKRPNDTSLESSETNSKKQRLSEDSKTCISISSSDSTIDKDDLKTEEKTSIKKESEVNSSNDVKIKTFDHLRPEIENYLQEHFKEQIDLRLRLHKKDEMYSKLKEKYALLEETFRNWINFAQGLQSRAKMVATQLHKQQETIKTLQSVHACQKVSVSVQTEKVFEDKTSTLLQKVPLHNSLPKTMSPHKSNPSGRLKAPPSTSKNKPNSITSPLLKRHSDVIDLTDEVENLAAKRDHSINQQVHRILQRKNDKNASPSQLPSNTIVRRPNQTSPRCVASLPGISNSKLAGFKPAVGANSVGYGNQQSIVYQQQMMRAATSGGQHMNNIQSLKKPTQNVRSIRPSHSKTTPAPNVIVQPTAVIHSGVVYPPLPVTPFRGKIPRGSLGPPPELALGIKKANGGIVLSWNNFKANALSAKVIGYELYAFHLASSVDNKEWKKIGDDTIAAMDLPMACTLSQFSSAGTYYFAVRGRDIYGRFGPFSQPCSTSEVT